MSYTLLLLSIATVVFECCKLVSNYVMIQSFKLSKPGFWSSVRVCSWCLVVKRQAGKLHFFKIGGIGERDLLILLFIIYQLFAEAEHDVDSLILSSAVVTLCVDFCFLSACQWTPTAIPLKKCGWTYQSPLRQVKHCCLFLIYHRSISRQQITVIVIDQTLTLESDLYTAAINIYITISYLSLYG